MQKRSEQSVCYCEEGRKQYRKNVYCNSILLKIKRDYNARSKVNYKEIITDTKEQMWVIFFKYYRIKAQFRMCCVAVMMHKHNKSPKKK